MSMTTWRKMIIYSLQGNKESWDDVKTCTLTEEELDVEFDNGYGGSNGKPFTMWTKNCVYFPVVYDGAEWAGSVPRNPCNIAKSHVGGE